MAEVIADHEAIRNRAEQRDTAERREHGDHDAARHAPDGSRGVQNRQGAGRDGAASSEAHSLQEREYRDENGDVHHHTNAYMDQHGGKH